MILIVKYTEVGKKTGCHSLGNTASVTKMIKLFYVNVLQVFFVYKYGWQSSSYCGECIRRVND